MAARQALLLVCNLFPEETKINFEGDATLVLAAMKGQGTDYSVFGPLINDLRCLLERRGSLTISYIQCDGNSATHRLARMGTNGEHEVVWFEDPPDLIQDILVEEGL